MLGAVTLSAALVACGPADSGSGVLQTLSSTAVGQHCRQFHGVRADGGVILEPVDHILLELRPRYHSDDDGAAGSSRVVDRRRHRQGLDPLRRPGRVPDLRAGADRRRRHRHDRSRQRAGRRDRRRRGRHRHRREHLAQLPQHRRPGLQDLHGQLRGHRRRRAVDRRVDRADHPDERRHRDQLDRQPQARRRPRPSPPTSSAPRRPRPAPRRSATTAARSRPGRSMRTARSPAPQPPSRQETTRSRSATPVTSASSRAPRRRP